jgi:membrane-associated phospholipid phosphatase
VSTPAMSTTYEHPWRRREWWTALAVAVLVVLLAGLVAHTGEVPGWEQAVFHGINGMPDFLYRPMWLFQLTGLLAVPAVVALVALVFRKWRLALALVLFIPLKLFVEHQVVKALVERQRPWTSICRGDASCGHFRDAPKEGLSFVSGHAIIAWGIATLVWPYLPRRWRWVPVAVAVSNSVARVYLGAHNPLDVVGGGAIGVVLGLLLGMLVGVPLRGSADGVGHRERDGGHGDGQGVTEVQ